MKRALIFIALGMGVLLSSPAYAKWGSGSWGRSHYSHPRYAHYHMRRARSHRIKIYHPGDHTRNGVNTGIKW